MRALLAASIVLAGACDGALASTDSRFATPERTVATLLESHGLGALSGEEIRARLAGRERIALRDATAYRLCFADLGDAAGEGAAGWVLGALAAGRDDLRTQIAGEIATVSPREGVRIVLRRDGGGAWRIVLRESVPAPVRQRLAALAERADARSRRTGASALLE